MENVRSTSVLSKIHKMFLRFLFSQSQFDHLRYNSLTLALSPKTAHKSTRSYSFITHSLATQEFPVIVYFIYWFSLHSCQNGHVLFVTQYDNNTFPTSKPNYGMRELDPVLEELIRNKLELIGPMLDGFIIEIGL